MTTSVDLRPRPNSHKARARRRPSDHHWPGHSKVCRGGRRWQCCNIQALRRLPIRSGHSGYNQHNQRFYLFHSRSSQARAAIRCEPSPCGRSRPTTETRSSFVDQSFKLSMTEFPMIRTRTRRWSLYRHRRRRMRARANLATSS